MTLVKWQPVTSRRGLANMHGDMNRMFDDLFHSENNSENKPANTCWSPRVDISELNDKFEFSFELPGLDKESVKVELNENVLSIAGEKNSDHEGEERNVFISERTFGSFHRSFRLPSEVKADEIKAEFSNGILNVVLPKAEEAKPKKIDIKFN